VLSGTLIQPVSTGLIDVNKSPFLAIHHWPLPPGTQQKSRAIEWKSRDAAMFKYVPFQPLYMAASESLFTNRPYKNPQFCHMYTQ